MMRTSDLIASAGRALRSNPLRSALTALGVIIGVASVVAMVALGSGAQAQVERSIASLGSNLLIVVPGAQRSGGGVRAQAGGGMGWDTLTIDDAAAIAQLEGVAVVAPSQRARTQVIANGLNWNPQVEGVTPSYLEARDWEISSGRMFDESEERQARRVVVLGATVANELFPNLDPVGQTVRMNGGAFEVIGVLESKGQSGFGADQDDIVLAPLTTVKRRISGRRGRGDSVSQISVKAQNEDVLSALQEDVETLLRQRHRTREGEDDFTVQNLSSITETAAQTTQVFTYLLGGISAVSLLVGGIGIMNIMLVSVTERTREIGLRKALGARQGDILRQFGLEAVTLSVAGGIIGLILGVAGAWLMTSLFTLPLVISPLNAGLAIAFSGLVGVLFGAYPAWRAAQLDPIEALRRE
ncbi:ABC transporter permease [Vitreimonas flagellata]|uniref:ABC transporter permease n=1 Tax=Vitreimonas flagellata TaxID=2560861 RepID=UPI0010750622|nr:ABC transporter permease [Vitreimonas flagellata]